MEFSHNFTVENIDNLESVKGTAESKFEKCSIENIHDKGILQILRACLQVEKSS